MRYGEFVTVRNTLLAQQATPPMRADEFHLYQALDAFKPKLPETGERKSSTPDELLALWTKRMKLTGISADSLVVTRGVKDTMRGLFPLLKAQGTQLWIPEDVYAGYRVITEETGLPFRTFATLPSPKRPELGNFRFLNRTGKNSTVILPHPLVPLGRYFKPAEVTQLKQWLKGSPQRLLILDTIFDPKTGFDRRTRALLKTGQCVVMHALSKTWLVPDTFGVTLAPTSLAQRLRPRVTPPTPEQTPLIAHCLTQASGLPQWLEHQYKQAWRTLQGKIREIKPDWKPPEFGYISHLPQHFEALLKKFQVLTAPASIFGSRLENTAVVSALNAMLNRTDTRKAAR